MKSAVLKVAAGGEKLRFEVQSTPHHRTGPSHGPHTTTSTSGVQKWYMKANHPAEVARWTQAIRKSIEWYQVRGGVVSREHLHRNGSSSDASSLKTRSRSGKHSRRGSVGSSGGDDRSEADPLEKGGDDARSVDQSSASGSMDSPPHSDTIELQANATSAQLELTGKLFRSYVLLRAGPRDVEDALEESFAQVHSLVGEYVRMTKEREEWYKQRLDKESDRVTRWEESLSVVVREGEVLEQELRKRGRGKARRRSTLNLSESGTLTMRQKPAREPPLLSLSAADSPLFAPPIPGEQIPTIDRPPLSVSVPVVGSPPPTMSEDGEVDTDEEDEFFDAIESNNLPNLVISDTLRWPVTPVKSLPPSIGNLDPYQGYAQLRDRLPIKSDDRPSTSLWQVLKGSIGKDLTKISFPVYFNEPTSMLQRMVRIHFLPWHVPDGVLGRGYGVLRVP